LGGVLADAFGYANSFKWTSVTIFISAMIVAIGVKEIRIQFADDAKEYKSYSSKEVLQHIIKQPVLFVVMLISALIHVAHLSIQPILSLYVAELLGIAYVDFILFMSFFCTG